MNSEWFWCALVLALIVVWQHVMLRDREKQIERLEDALCSLGLGEPTDGGVSTGQEREG